jgi:hypothetical protein
LAARLGRGAPAACFAAGGAGGGGGLAAPVLFAVGLVAGAGGGTLRPVVVLATCGLGAFRTPPIVSRVFKILYHWQSVV